MTRRLQACANVSNHLTGLVAKLDDVLIGTAKVEEKAMQKTSDVAYTSGMISQRAKKMKRHHIL